MNTAKSIATFTTLGGMLLAALVTTGCASPGRNRSAQVVEEKGFIQMHHVRDTSEPLDLKKGDAVAMVCAKCRTVWYHDVFSPASTFPYTYLGRPSLITPGAWAREQQRQAFEDWALRHYCPGCKSTVTITGTWLNRRETVKHTCESCGDDSIFCCARTTEAAVPKE